MDGGQGALSVFLAGELEKPRPRESPSPGPATPVPHPGTWRTPFTSTKRVSLLNIQLEEAAAQSSGRASSGCRISPSTTPSPSLPTSTDPAIRVSIADLVAARRSAPIPLAKREPSPGAWGSIAGTSPPVSAQHNLRVIQAEQQEVHPLGKSWGKSPLTPGHALTHMSSWRERRSAVSAAGASPGGGLSVLGSSPGALLHRSPAS